MDNTINYSIIIPHKNIPKLLDRCINSIPNRNDIEIIIVDDNSDDVTELYKLDSLKRSNVQLHLISKTESKGAGRARNLGLSVAKGKWCIFADADDFFITASLNKMMDTYINSSTDIVYFNVECLPSISSTYLTCRFPSLNSRSSLQIFPVLRIAPSNSLQPSFLAVNFFFFTPSSAIFAIPTL